MEVRYVLASNAYKRVMYKSCFGFRYTVAYADIKGRVVTKRFKKYAEAIKYMEDPLLGSVR